MAMDRYKVTKIESGTAGAAAKEHRDNAQSRDETGKSDKKNTLTKAFENYHQKTGPKTDRGPFDRAQGRPSTEDRRPKTENGERRTETQRTESGKRKTENGVRTELQPTNHKSRVAHHDSRTTNPESRTTNHEPRSTNPQTSTFTQNVKTPPPVLLADLLLKTPHPKAPPTLEQRGTKDHGPRTMDQKQSGHTDSLKSVIPTANPEGAKMASTTTGKEQGEVGKKEEKKEPKKSEGAKSAQGKSGPSSAEKSDGEQKLEAASSGVASDGGEPALVQGFNVESLEQANFLTILEGRYLYERILKSLKPQEKQVFATAVALNENPELERILGLRRPFPTDVNGGRRG